MCVITGAWQPSHHRTPKWARSEGLRQQTQSLRSPTLSRLGSEPCPGFRTASAVSMPPCPEHEGQQGLTRPLVPVAWSLEGGHGTWRPRARPVSALTAALHRKLLQWVGNRLETNNGVECKGLRNFICSVELG